MSDNKISRVGKTDPQIAQSQLPALGTVTSSFFVSMDDLFETANVEDLEYSVQLLWYTSVEERPSIGSMTSDFQASATIVHSLLEMHILTDSAMPTLRQKMRDNSAIDEIRITRVGHLGEGNENTELYSSSFSECYLEAVEEFPDRLIVKARVSRRYDTAITTDFGETEGPQNASGWDYILNKADAG